MRALQRIGDFRPGAGARHGDSEIVCEVKDYCCHQEAEIIKDGAVVKKLSISGGRITEI